MAQHLTNAPSDVDEGIIKKCEKLVETCQTTKEEIDSGGSGITEMGEARSVAENLISETSEAQEEIGLR